MEKNYLDEVDNILNHVDEGFYGAYIKTDVRLKGQVNTTSGTPSKSKNRRFGLYTQRYEGFERLLSPPCDRYNVLSFLLDGEIVTSSEYHLSVELDVTDEECEHSLSRTLCLPRPGERSYSPISHDELYFIVDEVIRGLSGKNILNQKQTRSNRLHEFLKAIMREWVIEHEEFAGAPELWEYLRKNKCKYADTIYEISGRWTEADAKLVYISHTGSMPSIVPGTFKNAVSKVRKILESHG